MQITTIVNTGDKQLVRTSKSLVSRSNNSQTTSKLANRGSHNEQINNIEKQLWLRGSWRTKVWTSTKQVWTRATF